MFLQSLSFLPWTDWMKTLPSNMPCLLELVTFLLKFSRLSRLALPHWDILNPDNIVSLYKKQTWLGRLQQLQRNISTEPFSQDLCPHHSTTAVDPFWMYLPVSSQEHHLTTFNFHSQISYLVYAGRTVSWENRIQWSLHHSASAFSPLDWLCISNGWYTPKLYLMAG